MASKLRILVISSIIWSMAWATQPPTNPLTILGAPDAPVTLIDISFLGCHHCKDFHAQAFQELKENYVDKGILKVVFIDGVAGDGVYTKAHQALYASKNSKQFYQYASVLFKNQGSVYAIGESEIIRLGVALGIKKEAIIAQMNNKKKEEELGKIANYYFKKYDVTGTPTLVLESSTDTSVKSVRFSGNVDYKRLESAIEKIRREEEKKKNSKK